MIVRAALVVELGQPEHHVRGVAGLVGVALEELLELGDGVEPVLALVHLDVADGLLVAGGEVAALLLVLLLHQQLDVALEVARLGLVAAEHFLKLVELLLLGRGAPHALE